jgi:radical SAM superfamily enzyme YgiQ (UPF0313 family)
MKYASMCQRESVDHPRSLPYAWIFTSRGCPIGCSFCEVEEIAGRKVRFRSVDNVLDEIEWLKETYGITSLMFGDDKMIDRRLNIKWNAISVAIFNLDEEMVELMEASGCQYLDIAIESGVERVLREIINKPVKLEYVQKMIEKIKEVDIDISANFIIGFPGEKWQEIRETIRFAESIDVDYVKIFIATPLPKTKLYKIAKEGGYLKEDFSFNRHNWSYGQIQTDEFNPWDLGILRAYEWDRINFSTPEKRRKIAKMMNVTEERLDQIRRETLLSVINSISHWRVSHRC